MRVRSSTLVVSLACLLSLMGSEALAFNVVVKKLSEVHWQNRTVGYKVHPAASNDIDENGNDGHGVAVTEREALQTSFQSWHTVDGVDIEFVDQGDFEGVETGNDGVNAIVWVNENWGRLEFSPPSTALAVTINTYKSKSGILVDSDIHFNGSNYDWVVINTPQEEAADVMDIQNIATHEIGHFIGLDHSSEKASEFNDLLYEATMYYASSPGEIFRRQLNADDINAIRHLYAAVDPSAPRIQDVAPRVADNRMGEVTFEIVGTQMAEFVLPKLFNESDESVLLGQVIERGTDGSGNGFLQVTFDLSSASAGEYDLVLNNGPEIYDRLQKAVIVEGNVYYSRQQASGGGCGVLGGTTGNSNDWGVLLILLSALGTLMLSRRRLVGAPTRSHPPSTRRHTPQRDRNRR